MATTRGFGRVLVAVAALMVSGVASSVAQAQGAAADAVSWGPGFRLQTADGKYSVGIGGYLQPLFLLNADDQGDMYDNTPRFLIRRARVSIPVNLFDKRVYAFVLLGFDEGHPRLFDAFTDVKFLGGQLQLRFGQWRRPFLREWITSATKLEMVERSILTGSFDVSRDIGLALHNGYETAPQWEWFVGVFNGTGDKTATGALKGTVDEARGTVSLAGFKLSNTPAEFHPMLVARVAWNSTGGLGYAEMDLEGGAPRFSVALAGILDFDFDNDAMAGLRGSLEFGMKAYGLSLTVGGYALSNARDQPFGTQDLQRIGVGFQAGYVIARQFQPAVRFAWVAPYAKDELGDSTLEAGLGFSWYAFANNLKLQTDLSWLRNDGGVLASGDDQDDLRFRLQLQVAF